MAPSLLLLPRGDAFASPPSTGSQETREASGGGGGDSIANTTWAVVAIVLGAFLMVTLVIFGVLYYMRWRQLVQASLPAQGTAAATNSWDETADPTLRQHRSRKLQLDPAAAAAAAAGSLSSVAPKRLRRMTSEDQAEAHELERSLMIRKSLASRESWGSNTSHNTLVHHGGGNDNQSDRSSRVLLPSSAAGGAHAGGDETPASRYRSRDSLKTWEAGAVDPSSRRGSRVVPATSIESLRGHPALDAQDLEAVKQQQQQQQHQHQQQGSLAAGPSRTPLPPPAPGLEKKRMSPLPPLPIAHAR